MNAKTAAELREAWGDKPCVHPRIEAIGHSGLEACSQCGRIITRDQHGKPVPNTEKTSLEGLAHAQKAETGIATASDEAVFCLIDVRRGEVLWSLGLPVGMTDLREASDADLLVEQAYREFKAAKGL